MAKARLSFSCTNCGYATPKWVGCCPGCSEWNSFAEQQQPQGPTAFFGGKSSGAVVQSANLFSLTQISSETQPRMLSNIKEWDRVLGGGVLPGSFIILTGDPGIGK